MPAPTPETIPPATVAIKGLEVDQLPPKTVGVNVVEPFVPSQFINNTTLEQENTNNDSIENSDNDDSDDSINNGENNNIVNDTIEQPMLVNNQEPEIPLNNLENIFLTALQNTELYMDYNELLQMQSILMQDFNNN